jgi:hypothetical protein
MTILADLVRRQASLSLLGTLNRTVEKAAEEMALDLMREPEFRDQMRALVREAFSAALQELKDENNKEPPLKGLL